MRGSRYRVVEEGRKRFGDSSSDVHSVVRLARYVS